MAEAEADARGRCRRARRCPTTTPFLDASVRERWNDYGIGLLLQGDLQGRRGGVPEGHGDGARVRRRLGERGAGAAPGGRPGGRARTCSRKALAVDPKLAKTHFFLGTALKAQGRYDEALAHLRAAPALSTRATASC